MRDDDGSGGGDPSRFNLRDDFSTDISFFATQGQLPWNPGEPSDRDRAEDCVE